jgi:hypothetical protein
MLTVETFFLEMDTTAGTDILDLTPQIQSAVKETGLAQGVVHLFISGSTAALTTIEYETGVVNDLRAALERLFPGTSLMNTTAAGATATATPTSGPRLSSPASPSRWPTASWPSAPGSRSCCLILTTAPAAAASGAR